MTAARVELAGLRIGDDPQRWTALGFDVVANKPPGTGLSATTCVVLGGVVVQLGAGPPGISAWTLRGASGDGDIDGLRTLWTEERAPASGDHPNGAQGIDHVVIATPDFDRTVAALSERGLELRRIRQAGDRRQGFRRLGPAIMEIVEAPEAESPFLWGMTVVVADLVGFAATRPHVGRVRPAVQPGRRIAALDAAAGLTTRLAFMDPPE